jgi:hypothetical protein
VLGTVENGRATFNKEFNANGIIVSVVHNFLNMGCKAGCSKDFKLLLVLCHDYFLKETTNFE